MLSRVVCERFPRRDRREKGWPGAECTEIREAVNSAVKACIKSTIAKPTVGSVAGAARARGRRPCCTSRRGKAALKKNRAPHCALFSFRAIRELAVASRRALAVVERDPSERNGAKRAC